MALRMQRFISLRPQRTPAARGSATTAIAWRRGMRSLLAALLAVIALTVTAIGAPRASAAPAMSGACSQAPAQSMRDRASYTPAELDRYGLPQRTPGEPFAKWATIVRGAGQRICGATRGETVSWTTSTSFNWAGNVADESTAGQKYTEADMDYFVPCIGAPPSPDPDFSGVAMAAWIGIGGSPGGKTLIQAGTAAFQTYNGTSWQTTYKAFYENTGASNPAPYYPFLVKCNDHMYVKAYNSGSTGCMFIQRISDGLHGGSCYGPAGYTGSAEAIAEYSQFVAPYFARFGTVTFKGVGITDNAVYKGIDKLPHTTYELYAHSCNSQVVHAATVGGFQTDTGNTPPVKYAVTWLHQGFNC